jgi:SAM-dependent methyltransferase
MDQDAIISNYAQRICQTLAQLLPRNPNEAEFRQPIDQLLAEFCEKAELNPLAHAEYTLATGRADAVFNRLVIEYERPGTLSEKPNDRQTRRAVEQVKHYIQGIAHRHRQEMNRIAGVVFDGHYLIFVRYREGNFAVEPPMPVSTESLERFLRWLASTASGIALTAENLKLDFSIEQLRTQNILRALMRGLQQSLSAQNGMVPNLFRQWQTFFSQSIDYSEAFGGRKLEPLQKWARKAGLSIQTAEEAERFFFVLHTYFALLAKLLAWLALSRHLAVKLGGPAFGELLTADSHSLQRHLRELESGGIFRKYGIANLLEGDFFEWYLFAWNSEVEQAVRDILKRLDDYDPSTLTVVPEESRDLFKQLYHYLLPREIRHNLGEYYTPDWLAQRLLTQVDNEFFADDPRRNENRLREKLLRTRWLDPACGSGTFLVLIIAQMRKLGRELFVNEGELLDAVLRNVVGFDLNPLAVLTARVNYLLAIADLLPYRKSSITIPVYLADSVRTPAQGEELFSHDTFEFPTAVGALRVPAVLCQPGRFDRFCDLLEESLHAELAPQSFLQRIEHTLRLQEWSANDRETARELYETLLNLHRQGMDGLWARLLKNTFAPLTVGQFDYVVGNPPWVNWEHLPDGYRESIKPLWVRYGLFPHGGMDTILGKGKKDIAMLMAYTVTDRLLKEHGKLGFVVTQSVFKTSGAGQGFRQFRIPTGNQRFVSLKVLLVDDMVTLQPFEGASNRTAVVIWQKGRHTQYPVPYTLWRKVKGARFTYDSTLEEVTAATKRLHLAAEPVNEHDATSPWLTARPKALKAIRKVLGRSDYRAHEGVNTGGANAVYWVEKVLERPDGLVLVRNLVEHAKIKVDEVTEPIEPDLLYPLLRGRDVRRWRAEPSAWILMVQDPVKRRGIDEEHLQTRYPYTYGYLKRFEGTLRKRAAFTRYFTRREKDGRVVETGPFYSMFDVGGYTFAPWKVVWPNIASSLEAAVVGSQHDQVIVPQHIVTLVACDSEAEAHYICAAVNSSPANFAARAYSQEGGKSFGDPHILEHIRIPRFEAENPVHRRLSEVSREAHALVAGAGSLNRLKQVEQEIDALAAQLWGLEARELKEVQHSLRELGGENDYTDEENGGADG